MLCNSIEKQVLALQALSTTWQPIIYNCSFLTSPYVWQVTEYKNFQPGMTFVTLPYKYNSRIGREHTNIRLFFCQCNNCSCCVRLGAECRLECLSLSIEDLKSFPIPWSFSLRFGKLLQSKGLHKPKSESFKCPLRSSSRLSGLISLSWKIKFGLT